MADGHGGYREPAHPAPSSGIGKNSRRTDGGPVQKIYNLPDAAYGENKQFVDEQRSAPLAAGPQAVTAPSGPSPVPTGAPQDLSKMVTPLSAPTERPGEPVTHGADAGAGAGASALNLPTPVQQAQQSAAEYITQAAQGSSDPMLQFLAGAVQSRY